MAKFLYVRRADHDAACINVDFITDIALDGSGSIHIGFQTDDSSTAGVVECACTATPAAERAVLLAITKAIASSHSDIAVLFDSETSEYLVWVALLL